VRRDLFHGLPAEFCPPEAAAAQIAALKTKAEREAYWLRLPAWRQYIAYVVALEIGRAIVELHTLEERRAALLEVPDMWREQVEWRVRHLWNSKAVREMSDADFRAMYPGANVRGGEA
jgi:hypothetical protein